ncbi:MAG: cupin domain-containing protein [Planctomycetaceae bacterium]
MTPESSDSTYVDVVQMDWQPTPFVGIEIKVLWRCATSAAYTALFRVAPGARLPRHRHIGVEQTFVLEGSLVDEHGACTAGNFVWRRPESIHEAYSPDGCLAIGVFQSPNEFMEVESE